MPSFKVGRLKFSSSPSRAAEPEISKQLRLMYRVGGIDRLHLGHEAVVDDYIHSVTGVEFGFSMIVHDVSVS